MPKSWIIGLVAWTGLVAGVVALANAQNVQDLLDQQELVDVVPPTQAPDGTWVVSIAYLADYELAMESVVEVEETVVESGVRGVPLWLGETGSAWGGGAPGLSDTYLAGFM